MKIKRFKESENDFDEKLKRLKESFNVIRGILSEFEDENLIEYYPLGYTYSFKKDHDFLEKIINTQDDPDSYHSDFDTWSILCEIKINSDCHGSKVFLESKDFDVVEDVMIAIKRLESSGYGAKLTLEKTCTYKGYSCINIYLEVKK